MSTGRGEELGVLKPSVYHTALVRFLLRLNLNLEKEEKGSVLKKKKNDTFSYLSHTCDSPNRQTGKFAYSNGCVCG